MANEDATGARRETGGSIAGQRGCNRIEGRMHCRRIDLDERAQVFHV